MYSHTHAYSEGTEKHYNLLFLSKWNILPSQNIDQLCCLHSKQSMELNLKIYLISHIKKNILVILLYYFTNTLIRKIPEVVHRTGTIYWQKPLFLGYPCSVGDCVKWWPTWLGADTAETPASNTGSRRGGSNGDRTVHPSPSYHVTLKEYRAQLSHHDNAATFLIPCTQFLKLKWGLGYNYSLVSNEFYDFAPLIWFFSSLTDTHFV